MAGTRTVRSARAQGLGAGALAVFLGASALTACGSSATEAKPNTGHSEEVSTIPEGGLSEPIIGFTLDFDAADPISTDRYKVGKATVEHKAPKGGELLGGTVVTTPRTTAGSVPSTSVANDVLRISILADDKRLVQWDAPSNGGPSARSYAVALGGTKQVLKLVATQGVSSITFDLRTGKRLTPAYAWQLRHPTEPYVEVTVPPSAPAGRKAKVRLLIGIGIAGPDGRFLPSDRSRALVFGPPGLGLKLADGASAPRQADGEIGGLAVWSIAADAKELSIAPATTGKKAPPPDKVAIP